MSAPLFGTFSLTYSALILLLALTRAFIGTRLVLYVAQTDPDDTAPLSGALTSVLLLAPAATLITFASYLALITPIEGLNSTNALVALVVSLAAPLVCIQDILRYSAIAYGRSGVALVSDAVWFAIMAVAVLSGWAAGPLPSLVTWGGGALIASLLLVVPLAPRLDRAAARSMLRLRYGVSETTALGVVAGTIATFVVVSAAAAIIGPTSAGSLRGAATLMGPVNVALAFVDISLVGYLARRKPFIDRVFCGRFSIVTALVIAIWAVMLLSIPDAWGVRLLGDSWRGARTVLPWTALEYVALGPLGASALGLKVRGEVSRMLLARGSFAVCSILLGLGFAVIFHRTQAVSMALAVSALMAATISWALFLKSAPGRATG